MVTGATQSITSPGSPNEPTIAGADSIFYCNENPNPITATAVVSADSLTWYSDAALTDSIETGNTYTPPNVIGSNTYYVTEKDGDCESTPDEVTIIIYAIPVAPTASDLAICYGEDVNQS